jgi:hypothetical protein
VLPGLRKGGVMLACPSCGGTRWQVINSRPNPEGVWRRRQCRGCGERFTSQESFVEGQVRGTSSAAELAAMVAEGRAP